MTFEDRLFRIAVHGVEVPDREHPGAEIDSRTIALTRLASLVAIGGSTSSYADLADAALSAGASPGECVSVLESIVEIVGVPRVVQAAPKLAMALGYDIETALEGPVTG